VAAVLAAAVALAAGGIWWARRDGKAVQYRTGRVERGDLVQTVRATGEVQPVKKVQVGTQVTGPVLKLNADFNSVVKAGDVVAQIDPAVYEARVAQDKANLLQAEASAEQIRARLEQSRRELDRSRELARRDLLSKSELEAAEEELAVLEAQRKVAEASMEQARAQLRLSTANLQYTTIRSPVDGVVVARNVDEGQTVVASLSAQTIFQIATDLSQVQVQAAMPEADIGGIRPGQPVSFTVDAYEQPFTGEVAQVRLAATSQQNVVTYPVIITATNPEGKLFPGMTANLTVEVGRRERVLKIPNAALRFKPEGAAPIGPPDRHRQGSEVWTLAGGQPRGVAVKTGVTDGLFTELVEGDLAEGAEVITGVQRAEQQAAQAVNPFAPQLPPRMMWRARP
jgi:HlyD family secretion protein